VFGISSGGLLALEACVRGLSIPKVAVYEPPVILDVARAKSFEVIAKQLDDAAKANRRADAVELFLTQAVQVPAAAVAQRRQSPMWSGLEALAHTLSYDVRISERGPSWIERASSVRASTLVMDGGASPPWMREACKALASAIPDARHLTFEGQTHDVDIKTLARALDEFLGK
jgi:hypothetical protein